MIGWDELVSLARELPEFEESTSYGRPALKVRGKFFAALRTDPDAIVVKCDLEEKPLLLATTCASSWFDSWLLAAPKRLAAQFQPE